MLQTVGRHDEVEVWVNLMVVLQEIAHEKAGSTGGDGTMVDILGGSEDEKGMESIVQLCRGRTMKSSK